jgi:magnesium-transporting ATPase (P-type)
MGRAMNKEFVNRPTLSAANKRPTSPLAELCTCTPNEGLARLDAVRTGLTKEQVEARLEQYGPNEVTQEKPPTWYQQLFHAFLTPFNGVLFAVSIVSLFSDVIFAAPEDRSFRTIIVLMSMVLLSTLLRFWQEFRSNKAAEELKAMVTSTTAVLRAGMERPQEMPISTLVPGDIVYGPSRHIAHAKPPCRFRREADIKWRAGLAGSVAIDHCGHSGR